MTDLPCRTLEDVVEQSANGEGNPIWQIAVLCAEIKNLHKKIEEMDRNHTAFKNCIFNKEKTDSR